MTEEKLFRIYGYYQPSEDSWYVGRTSKEQKERAGKEGYGYRKCPKFADAIKRCGWPSFEYHVLETTTDEELSYELEKKWISQKDSFRNGYNDTLGGKGSLGFLHSFESKEKMSEFHKGQMINRPDEAKRVLQFTKDGQFITEYPSIQEAARRVGTSAGNITACCKGRKKSIRDSYWKYAS